MLARRLLAALAALVALGSASRSAAAQRAAASVASVSTTPIAAAPAASRVVAQYTVRGTRGELGAPARLTIADSTGALVATVRLFGEATARPMVVTVMETDVVLQAETPRGLLTIVLPRQNDDASPFGAGRWSLGSEQGVLRGRARRS